MLTRPAIWFAGLLLAAGFVLGLGRLFELRLARGDIYPPYSTLRTDPLGASVFYESLPDVPGVSAERWFEATFHADAGRGRTLFVLGAEPDGLSGMPRPEFEALDRFVYNGGRVVVAYFPESFPPTFFDATNEPAAQPAPGKKTAGGRSAETNSPAGPEKNQDKDDAGRGAPARLAFLKNEWGFDFAYQALATNDAGEINFPDARRVAADRQLPATLAVHTALVFTNLAAGWQVIYRRAADAPVVVERRFGAGAVALVADAYPFSNEALFKERRAGLLAWALGGGRAAIFDEAHLGVVEQPGLATLMRRYRLHGLIFSLLAVAGLFVWKNAGRLVPPPPERAAGAVVHGRDSAAGLVNLLRRGIPAADLIGVCHAEWRKSAARLAALTPEQRRAVESVVEQQAAQPPRQRRPVEDYRRLAEILRRR